MITGDVAGQTKPTTAGGIYTCGIGGMLAGRALIKSVRKSDDSFLHGYEKVLGLACLKENLKSCFL